jgi:hypothetical protein
MRRSRGSSLEKALSLNISLRHRINTFAAHDVQNHLLNTQRCFFVFCKKLIVSPFFYPLGRNHYKRRSRMFEPCVQAGRVHAFVRLDEDLKAKPMHRQTFKSASVAALPGKDAALAERPG